MARPLSGKKTKKDENALRQQEEVKKYHFWSKEFLVRRFYTDNKDNLEEFKTAQEILYISIFYKHSSSKNIPFKVALEQILKKYNSPEEKEQFFSKVHTYFRMTYGFQKFEHETQSIMDTILNLTEQNPINKLEHYRKCSQFYIDNIKKQVLILKRYCQKYGFIRINLFIVIQMTLS